MMNFEFFILLLCTIIDTAFIVFLIALIFDKKFKDDLFKDFTV